MTILYNLYTILLYCRGKKSGHRPTYKAVFSICIAHIKKLKISSLTRSKVMEGVPKFKSKSRDPDHAPLGVIHHPSDSTRRGLSNKEKLALKCRISELAPGLIMKIRS